MHRPLADDVRTARVGAGLTCGEEVLGGLVRGAPHAPRGSRRGLGAAQGLMRHSGQAEGRLVHLQRLQLLGVCKHLGTRRVGGSLGEA